MKSTVHIFLICLIAPQLVFSQVAEKTLITSIHPDEHKIIGFDLEGKVEVEYWDGDIIRIQSQVSIQNVREAVLKSLVTAGRYRLVTNEEAGKLRVCSPGLKKQISLGGKPLQEQIAYLIYIPRSLTVEDPGVEKELAGHN